MIELEEAVAPVPIRPPDIEPPHFEPPPTEYFDPSTVVAALALPRPAETEIETDPEIPVIEEPVADTEPVRAATEYWAGVHARIAARLRPPSDSGSVSWNGVIYLDLTLDACGNPLLIAISKGAPPRVVEWIRSAVLAAAPFGPPPGSLRRVRIPIRFARIFSETRNRIP